MNDIMDENGLVPSIIVLFGITSRFPALTTNLTQQNERIEASKTAEAEKILLLLGVEFSNS